jgi:hypothetical protein
MISPKSTTAPPPPAPPPILDHTVCAPLFTRCRFLKQCFASAQVPVIFLPLLLVGAVLCTCCKCNQRRRQRVPEDDKDKKEENRQRRIPTTYGVYRTQIEPSHHATFVRLCTRSHCGTASWAALLATMQALQLRLRGERAQQYNTRFNTTFGLSFCFEARCCVLETGVASESFHVCLRRNASGDASQIVTV